jgi:hypothetical protein
MAFILFCPPASFLTKEELREKREREINELINKTRSSQGTGNPRPFNGIYLRPW